MSSRLQLFNHLIRNSKDHLKINFSRAFSLSINGARLMRSQKFCRRSDVGHRFIADDSKQSKVGVANTLAQLAATSAEHCAKAESIKTQAELDIAELKSSIAQIIRYGGWLFLGATGVRVQPRIEVLLLDYLWTEHPYIAGARICWKMCKVTEVQRFDDELVNRVHQWRGGNCFITTESGVLVPIIVTGPMGAGKSALLRRFAKEQPHCIYISLRGLDSGDMSSFKKPATSSRDLSSLCDDMLQQFGVPSSPSFISLISGDSKDRILMPGVQLESMQLAEARSKWKRLWSAFDLGLGLFKYWYPDRFVTVIFDEATFLAPADDDSKELATCKLDWFNHLVEHRAIRSGYDVLDARFVFATLAPKLAAQFSAIFI